MKVLTVGEKNLIAQLSFEEFKVLTRMRITSYNRYEKSEIEPRELEGKEFDLMLLDDVIESTNNIIWRRKNVLEAIEDLRKDVIKATFPLMTTEKSPLITPEKDK